MNDKEARIKREKKTFLAAFTIAYLSHTGAAGVASLLGTGQGVRRWQEDRAELEAEQGLKRIGRVAAQHWF